MDTRNRHRATCDVGWSKRVGGDARLVKAQVQVSCALRGRGSRCGDQRRRRCSGAFGESTCEVVPMPSLHSGRVFCEDRGRPTSFRALVKASEEVTGTVQASSARQPT